MTLQRLFDTPLLTARLNPAGLSADDQRLRDAIADVASSHTVDISGRPIVWRTRGWAIEADDRIAAPGSFWLAAICVAGAEGEVLSIEDPRALLLAGGDDRLAFAGPDRAPMPLIETLAADPGVVAIVPGYIRLTLPPHPLRRSRWLAVALHPRPAHDR